MYFRMYSRMFDNTTTTNINISDPDFLDNIQVVLGRHSLFLDEGTDVQRDVETIIGHEDFSK
jgi:hypothetical protein